jgi:hypothetical protein
METKRPNQKQYPKQPPVSFYLGDKATAPRRMENLKQLALEHVGTTRNNKPAVSDLLQAIADGKIRLVKAPDADNEKQSA